MMSRELDGEANRPWELLLILGLFLVLAVLYNVSTPIYESPDELQHAAFVVWLSDGQGLPILDPDQPKPWAQEGTQPPLYYWLAARLLGWLPHNEAGSLAEPNPYAAIGDPLSPDNKNRVLHELEQEHWPYAASVLFVHLARTLSTLMGAGTLLAIYRLGRIVLPERQGVALAMMGLVAFIPQFLFLSASINNDNLVILFTSWVLVLLASWLCAPRLPGWPSLAGLGVLLGLGALAKLSGLLLWPLAGGTMLWLAWRERRFRWLLMAGLLVFGLALALAGWWFGRNFQLYGDLSGFNAHLDVMGIRRRLPSNLGGLLAEFRGLRYSFWALFGWFNILVPEAFYWIVDGLTVVGLLGFVLFLVRSFRRQSPATRRIMILLITWCCLVVLGFVRWTLLTPASQGRLLYPALTALALFLVVGWAELIPRRLTRPAGITALTLWVGWAALCPFLFIKPAYALPERVQSLDELAVVPSELRVQYEECCELLGYVAPEAPVLPGDRVPLTLVWHASQAMEQDYALFVHAVTVDGQLVGQLDTYHGGGMYPTSQWHSGEFLVDRVYVPISQKAEGPALIRFSVGLHRLPGPERLSAFAPDGQELDVVFAGEAALVPFQWPESVSDLEIDAAFEGKIRLAGVKLSQVAAHPGEVVTATLQWAALDRIKEDYVGFVHLVDSGGSNVAQDDHVPMNGHYPTRLWFPGAMIVDAYRLELPAGLGEGSYELWAGFYRPESEDRLQAVSEQSGERWRNDLVYLGSIEVAVDGQ
jgi:4-amino-4-deoxy-L-arabinose transferase-like glycosyltransferase